MRATGAVCACGTVAVDGCAVCGTPVCREHSYVYDDALVCRVHLEARTHAADRRRADDYADLLRRQDAESSRLVTDFLERVDPGAARSIQIGRREVVQPPRLRTLRERWHQPLSPFKLSTDETTVHEYDYAPAHVVHESQSSDVSDPPVVSNAHVYVFLTGRVAVSEYQTRQGRPFGSRHSGVSNRSHTVVYCTEAFEPAAGFEPWHPHPAHLREAGAPIGALPFYYDGLAPVAGRCATATEIEATLRWFSECLNAYLESRRA
ncbi:MAG TPA: hypothetical protein VF529_19360 [Solirubrobacteraceae bacterium]|jgi:hypothetical protein